MLIITHTHEAGALIDGTSKGDGTAETLKQNGWRWGRSISAWYLPQSRDHLPKLHVIERTRKALQEAGFDVSTDIDHTRQATADVEAGKIQRQTDRVYALEQKAERKNAADDAAWQRAETALNRLPEGGEPIHVGHRSEGRHRNAIAKADTAMRRSVEASRDAEHARGRAEVASTTTEGRYAPVTVANRIETMSAELRKFERRIVEDVYDREHGYRPATDDEQSRRLDRLTPHIEEKRDQIAYWEGVRAAQIDNGKATGYDRSAVKKGDRIKVRGSWYVVVRANQKTVSVQTQYSWTDTVPYAEIQDLRQPE